MSRFKFEIVGVKDLEQFLARQPAITRKSLKFSINETTRWARNESSRRIRGQVNLSVAYLNSPRRLYVARLASDANLSATITARAHPTSLARYGARATRKGVKVKVKRGGKGRTIRQGFLVRLKGGNTGVAVRDTGGLNLKRINAGKSSSGFHVLYGPSVDQVFRSVRDDIEGNIFSRVRARFGHHFDRLNK